MPIKKRRKEKVKNNESIIKAIAVNKSGDIFQGLKNGTIRKFIPAEKSSKKVIEYEDIVPTEVGVIDNDCPLTVGNEE